MRDGEIYTQGTPDEVLTEETIEAVFGFKCRVIPDPVSHTPLCIPIGARYSDDPSSSRPESQTGPKSPRSGRS
jgi:iron complex transport system ATP-binding protein